MTTHTAKTEYKRTTQELLATQRHPPRGQAVHDNRGWLPMAMAASAAARLITNKRRTTRPRSTARLKINDERGRLVGGPRQRGAHPPPPKHRIQCPGASDQCVLTCQVVHPMLVSPAPCDNGGGRGPGQRRPHHTFEMCSRTPQEMQIQTIRLCLIPKKPWICLVLFKFGGPWAASSPSAFGSET